MLQQPVFIRLLTAIVEIAAMSPPMAAKLPSPPPEGDHVALEPEPTTPYDSVQYALRVLECVARHPSGVAEARLAQDTGLPPGHLAHLLQMLRREGYLEQLGDGTYVVGEPLVLLGAGGSRDQALRERLDRTLAELRDAVGAAVYLSSYHDGELEVMGYSDSPAHAGRLTSGSTSARPGTRPRSASACWASSTTTRAATTSPGTRPPGSPHGRSPTTGCCWACSTASRPPYRYSTCRSTRSARCARPCR